MDSTAARKNARTDEDAAAIAWAQDEIEKLRRVQDELVNFIRTSALNAGKFADAYDPQPDR